MGSESGNRRSIPRGPGSPHNQTPMKTDSPTVRLSYGKDSTPVVKRAAHQRREKINESLLQRPNMMDSGVESESFDSKSGSRSKTKRKSTKGVRDASS